MIDGWLKPQSAPRGLLRYYILRKIKDQQLHGYQLIRSIEEKSRGAWRPGPGSVYPILRELVSEGYLREVKPTKTSGRTVYEITEKGSERLGEVSRIITEAAEKLQDMKQILYDFAEPNSLAAMCLKGVRMNAQMLRKLVESKQSKMSPREKEALLMDLRNTLRQEKAWVDRRLSKTRRGRS